MTTGESPPGSVETDRDGAVTDNVHSAHVTQSK
jgi:hypothetical protein